MLLISHIYLTKKWGRVKRGKEVGKEKQKGKNLYDEVLGRMTEQKEGFLPVSWYFPTQQKNPLCSLRGKKVKVESLVCESNCSTIV